MYAWESADTGEETTPEQVVAPDGRIIDVLCGKQEQHITADVAYAVWQYWEATRDEQFLLDAGVEILLETGRFWSSRAQTEADGYCHICGVIGPDEYHEGIDDNAFTNVMARWNIRRALDVAALLRECWPDHWAGLSSRLGLNDADLALWRRVAERMVTGWTPQTGLFEQFAGFFGLEDIDLSAYEGRSVPLDIVLGRERTQRSKLIKQADVVALLGLLPEEFPGESAAANFRYYEPRCSHGSSLSGAMHALVAARLGYSGLALRYFQQAAAIDLADTHTAITGGLHMAALGGTWQAPVFGFAGLSLRSDGIAFEPKLPDRWRSLGFRIEWRQRRLRIRIDAAEHLLQATLEAGDSMTLLVNGRQYELRRNQAITCPSTSRTDVGLGIGHPLTLCRSTIMTNREMGEIVRNQKPLLLESDATIQIACKHMHDRRVGAVLVTNKKGQLVGIFTGRDAVRCLAKGKDPVHAQLKDVMTRNPQIMPPRSTAIEALRLMRDGGFRHIPVVQDGMVIGVVSRGDFRGLEQDRLDEETGIWERI